MTTALHDQDRMARGNRVRDVTPSAAWCDKDGAAVPFRSPFTISAIEK
jgi:hypothetical protein